MKQAALPLRRFAPVLFLLLILTNNTGCYRYRIMAPDFDPGTEYQSATVHSLLWGTVQTQALRPENCSGSNGLDEVRVSTNLGYSIINVVTLGIWCPMKIEWRCSKPCQKTGKL